MIIRLNNSFPLPLFRLDSKSFERVTFLSRGSRNLESLSRNFAYLRFSFFYFSLFFLAFEVSVERDDIRFRVSVDAIHGRDDRRFP